MSNSLLILEILWVLQQAAICYYFVVVVAIMDFTFLNFRPPGPPSGAALDPDFNTYCTVLYRRGTSWNGYIIGLTDSTHSLE
jgi:hypothetical protein